MLNSTDVAGSKSADVARARLSHLFLIIFLVSFGICLFDLIDGRLFLGDIDDQMREIQIRHLLFGGGRWWDLSLPAVMLPDPYVSPWSRLVDAPYVAITSLLYPFLGGENALLFAFHIWPPVMLGVFSLQCAGIYRRMGVPASLLGYVVVAGATTLMFLAVWEFAPGRIDHHNMQIIALMTVLYGLVRWDRMGARLAGLGTVVAVAISLEGLPFVAVTYILLALALFRRVDGAPLMMRHAAVVMFWLTLPLAYALLGPIGMLSTQCDAFSAPYIVLLTGFSVVLWLVARFMADAFWFKQAVAMVVPASALMFVFARLFPQCLAGPYWMIDPVSKMYWLQRVAQEHSALRFIEDGQTAMVGLIVTLACVLTYASTTVARRRKNGWFGLLTVLIVAWVALVLTLLLNRYIRFAFAFAPLFVPAAIQFFLQDTQIFWRRAVSAVVVTYLVFAGLLIALIPLRPEIYDAADFMTYDTCERGVSSTLADMIPGRIAAPQGMGLTLLQALPPGFSVAAIPFHRASPGMKLVFEAFLTSDPAVRKDALSSFDYVAVCRFPLQADTGKAPLYDALSGGRDWPGLIRQPTGADNPFQLFRIDHTTLQ